MNILHLRSSEFFGGPERAILGQCLSLKKFNLMCASFVRGQKPNRFLKECAANGIKTIAVPESFTGDYRVIKKLRKIITEFRLDIIVTHDYKANFFGLHAVKGNRAKQVAHFRGSTAEDFKDRIYNRINWRTLNRIEHILTVSEPSRQILIERGITPESVHVVFNAINCNDETMNTNQSVKTLEGPIRVVAAGRLSYEKGYDVLINALALLPEDAPDFRVSIYGHGPDENKLKNMVNGLGLNGKVEFCGFIDDVKPVFRKSDFLILPSRSEGMPNVILEAWSENLGVLSTAVGGVPDMIKSGENGLLVDKENEPALAEKFRFALDNVELMHQYGRAGRETVEKRYSYQKQAELLEKIYKEIADSGDDN